MYMHAHVGDVYVHVDVYMYMCTFVGSCLAFLRPISQS